MGEESESPGLAQGSEEMTIVMRSRTEKYFCIALIIRHTFPLTSHNDILLIKELM